MELPCDLDEAQEVTAQGAPISTLVGKWDLEVRPRIGRAVYSVKVAFLAPFRLEVIMLGVCVVLVDPAVPVIISLHPDTARLTVGWPPRPLFNCRRDHRLYSRGVATLAL